MSSCRLVSDVIVKKLSSTYKCGVRNRLRHNAVGATGGIFIKTDLREASVLCRDPGSIGECIHGRLGLGAGHLTWIGINSLPLE